MEVIFCKYGEKVRLDGPLCLALGTFDGFHLGHQEVIIKTRKKANSLSGILLFSAHPKTILQDKGYPVLMGKEEKIRMAESLGLDVCCIVEAEEGFFHLSKQEFMDFLRVGLGATQIVCGEDFRFGRNGEGNAADLKAHFDAEIVPLLYDGEKKISSSSIRELLKNGDIKSSNALLGHPYMMKGKVVHGLGNGSKIGFPTANLSLSENYLLPLSGVYFGLAYVLGVPHKAIINIGKNPTIGALSSPIVEVHILSFHGDIYDSTVYLYLLSFHREERRFPSLEALKEALQDDLDWAKQEEMALKGDV